MHAIQNALIMMNLIALFVCLLSAWFVSQQISDALHKPVHALTDPLAVNGRARDNTPIPISQLS